MLARRGDTRQLCVFQSGRTGVHRRKIAGRRTNCYGWDAACCEVRRGRSRPREGWAAAFQRMSHRGEDVLLDEDIGPFTAWDQEEWRW